MGDKSRDSQILLLFTLFGILVVLFLFLIAFIVQTWALWKIAKVVVEQNTEGGVDELGSRTSGVSFGVGGAMKRESRGSAAIGTGGRYE